MSLENRVEQMKLNRTRSSSDYSLIAKALNADITAIYIFFQNRKRGFLQDPVDTELAEIYELTPIEIPELALPNNSSFFSGFSYVGRQWYPWLNAVVISTPEDQRFLNQELERFFPDRVVTAQQVREELKADPSGATWLEEMVKAHFRNDNMERIGGLKSVTGAKKMYKRLTS